jgi:pimeloyl-ACP methyl ester carboxylesterase
MHTPETEVNLPAVKRCSRWVRSTWAAIAAIIIPVAWLGRLLGITLSKYRRPERYEHGLAIVLPGIEAQSFLNHGIVWGLSSGGWRGAIEIDDWTTTVVLLFLYHLRSWKRNLRQAQRIADRIVAYQTRYPGRPVHLIGHSGGGALSVLILEALPADRRITSAILLGPALSSRYPLQTALARTDRGIWSFWSYLDCVFCGAGTLLLGTLDGKHQPSAGMIGFRQPRNLSKADCDVYQRLLHQVGYSPRMLAGLNFGGHFGCVNPAFVEDWVAPLLGD